MKIFQTERGKGKTTALIYTSSITRYPIVVVTRTEVNLIENTAKTMGVDIPHPITLCEFKAFGLHSHYDGILIDNLDIMLPTILNDYFETNVVGATMNKE